MYALVKLFIISLLTFEIPDFVQFQSPENRFLFLELVRPLVDFQGFLIWGFSCTLCLKNHCTKYLLSLEMLYLIKLKDVTPELLTDYGNSEIKDDNL